MSQSLKQLPAPVIPIRNQHDSSPSDHHDSQDVSEISISIHLNPEAIDFDGDVSRVEQNAARSLIVPHEIRASGPEQADSPSSFTENNRSQSRFI